MQLTPTKMPPPLRLSLKPSPTRRLKALLFQGSFRVNHPRQPACQRPHRRNRENRQALFCEGRKGRGGSLCPRGDIGSVSKLSGVKTGDTLCAPGNIITARGSGFPRSLPFHVHKAQKEATRRKSFRVSTALWRRTRRSLNIQTTKPTNKSFPGLGEQHLDVVCSKLKNKFGVDVELSVPRVAYRETIRKRLRFRAVTKNSRAATANSATFGFALSPATPMSLFLPKRFSAVRFPKTSSPPLKKVFVTA